MTGIVILGIVAAIMYGVISALEKILLKTHLFGWGGLFWKK